MPRSDSFPGDALRLHEVVPDIDELLAPPTTDESEALAELFLGNGNPASASPRSPQRQPTRRPSRSAAPPIEGLILGHLPVLASAWVQQYARHIASELHGPIALLRLKSGEAVLELVSGNGVIHQPHEPVASSLGGALSAAAREAAALLVRTDETTEPRLAELAGLDTLTLLSGADEAATVASYRTIKNLTARMDAVERQPAIRLAIMGASASQATEASARIERAASAFLNRNVRVTSCISKIGGGKSTLLYRGPIHEPVESILRSLRQHFVPAPARAPHSAPRASAPQLDPHPAPAPQPVPDPIVSRIGHLSPSQVQTGTTAPLPRLSDHIPGLSPAPFTCPYAPEIEFAVDPRGGLHVLGHLDHAGRTLSHLLTASEWARAHDALLQNVLPRNPGSSATLHAFTADAAAARLLPGGTLRLHLLAQVQVGGNSTWFSTPLN